MVYAKACEKFDYLTTKPEDLKKLKSVLAEEGVEIEDVTGDVGTHVVIVFAHQEHIL